MTTRIAVGALLLGCVSMIVGCPPFPGSRVYRPLDWERHYLETADKSVFPFDVVNDFDLHRGALINWFGIIDSSRFAVYEDALEMTLYLDHKYYDYVEDFSIQMEKIFLSPQGEGNFVFNDRHVYSDPATKRQTLEEATETGNLAVCYGHVVELNSLGWPVISKGTIRFIHEKWYSTNIATYGVKRDSTTGRVILDEKGFPEIENWEVLRTPGPGRND